MEAQMEKSHQRFLIVIHTLHVGLPQDLVLCFRYELVRTLFFAFLYWLYLILDFFFFLFLRYIWILLYNSSLIFDSRWADICDHTFWCLFWGPHNLLDVMSKIGNPLLK
jgi:hypothetical protein